MPSDLPPESEEIPPPPTRPEVDADPTWATPAREPLLRRSGADRYLAGVAGGLGERLQLDPLVVRLGLVGTAMFGAYAGPDLHPFVLIPYFLAWMIVPPAQGKSLVSRIRERQALQEIAGAGVLLVIGLLVLADTRYAFAIGLAAAAIALLSDRRPGSEVIDENASPSDRSSFGPTVGQASKTDTTANLDPMTELPRPLMRGRNFNIGEGAAGLFGPRPQRPSRREPALWPLTLSLLVLIAIVGILIDTFTEPGMDPGVAVNLALLAIGSVLMLSFWRGRARITILWALALVPLWIGFSVANVGRFPGEGTARHFLTQADLSGDLIYQHGYGELFVDLQNVQLAQGSETTMAVDLTAGTARVLVPRDVEVKIKGKVGLGSFSVLDPMFFRIPGATLANGTINRSFQALGSDCFSQEFAEADIAQYASSIGLVIDEGQAVGDAMAAAGYDRPQFEFTDAVEEWYVDEEGLESIRLVKTDYYTVQIDGQGLLCTPVPPPENPATLIIEPTIGIGTLEVQRVDVP